MKLDEWVILLDSTRNIVIIFAGKPIVTANFEDWDLRKIAIAGRLNELNRHLDRAFENVTTLIRQLQKEGKVVTQFDFIINMDNYNLATQVNHIFNNMRNSSLQT